VRCRSRHVHLPPAKAESNGWTQPISSRSHPAEIPTSRTRRLSDVGTLITARPERTNLTQSRRTQPR
jgi:hypothetical protein